MQLKISEDKKIKKYIEGQTPSIQRAITNIQPDTDHDTKELAFSIIKKTTHRRQIVERMKAKEFKANKRKYDGNSRKPSGEKQIIKKFHIMTLKPYVGSLSRCNKCQYHHVGERRKLVYKNYGKKGHTTKSCRSPAHTKNKEVGSSSYHKCLKCGKQEHFKRNYPEN